MTFLEGNTSSEYHDTLNCFQTSLFVRDPGPSFIHTYVTHMSMHVLFSIGVTGQMSDV